MNQQTNSITLKQHRDGQIEVKRVKISQKVYHENSMMKTTLKKQMERILQLNHIKVLEDGGVIELDEEEDYDD